MWGVTFGGQAEESHHETDLGQEVFWGRGRVKGRLGVKDMREKQSQSQRDQREREEGGGMEEKALKLEGPGPFMLCLWRTWRRGW